MPLGRVTCPPLRRRLGSPGEYLSPQGVLLPRVNSTISSPLWLELRGPAAWQATTSWAVCRLACQRSLPWLRVLWLRTAAAQQARKSQVAVAIALQSVNNKEASNANCE